MRRAVAGKFLVLWLAGWLAAPPTVCQPRRPPGPGPGVANPRAGRALDRLSRMPPEQRRRVLEQLPPERRKRIEDQLERYNTLPPEERERLRQQLERFQDLPPERQEAVRKLFRHFILLPPPRRQLLQEEFRLLRELDPAGRRARISSDEFRTRYAAAERQILQNYADLLQPPK